MSCEAHPLLPTRQRGHSLTRTRGWGRLSQSRGRLLGFLQRPCPLSSHLTWSVLGRVPSCPCLRQEPRLLLPCTVPLSAGLIHAELLVSISLDQFSSDGKLPQTGRSGTERPPTCHLPPQPVVFAGPLSHTGHLSFPFSGIFPLGLYPETSFSLDYQAKHVWPSFHHLPVCAHVEAIDPW